MCVCGSRRRRRRVFVRVASERATTFECVDVCELMCE